MNFMPIQIPIKFKRETPFLRQLAASFSEPVSILVKGAEVLFPTTWPVDKINEKYEAIRSGIETIVHTEISLRSTLASLQSRFAGGTATIPGCPGPLLNKDSMEFEMLNKRSKRRE